ncbi:MAG: hypothetical protein AB1730_03575 [Myxococcota bacterium]
MRLALLVFAAMGLVLLARPPRANFGDDPRLLLPEPRLVALAGRSHLSLITDYYWIRMTHLAAVARTPYEARALVALGDFVTELDPRLYWAYVVGGLLGPVLDGGSAAWLNVPESTALLDKGTRHIPEDGRLYLLLSYAQLNYLDDKASAAKTLERGARRATKHNEFMAQLGTRLFAASGRFDAARSFARTMIENADTPETKAVFEHRLKLIDLEERLAQVDDAIRRFTARMGRRPSGIDELVAFGELGALPVDPMGGTIELGPRGAYSTAARERLQVFRQGQTE